MRHTHNKTLHHHDITVNSEPTLCLRLLQHSPQLVHLGRELRNPGGEEGGAVAVRGGRRGCSSQLGLQLPAATEINDSTNQYTLPPPQSPLTPHLSPPTLTAHTHLPPQSPLTPHTPHTHISHTHRPHSSPPTPSHSPLLLLHFIHPLPELVDQHLLFLLQSVL